MLRSIGPHIERRAGMARGALVAVLTIVSAAIACYDLVLLALGL